MKSNREIHVIDDMCLLSNKTLTEKDEKVFEEMNKFLTKLRKKRKMIYITDPKTNSNYNL